MLFDAMRLDAVLYYAMWSWHIIMLQAMLPFPTAGRLRLSMLGYAAIWLR